MIARPALILIDEIHNQHYPTEENPMEPLIRNGRAPLTHVDERLIGHHVTVYRKDTHDSQPLASGPIVRVAPPLSTDWDELNGFMVSLPVGEFFARLIHHDAYLTLGAIDPTQEPPTVTLEHTLEPIDHSDIGLRIAAMTAAATMDGTNPVDVAKQFYEFLTETRAEPLIDAHIVDDDADLRELYDWIDTRLMRDNPGTEENRLPRVDRHAPVYRTRRFHLSFRMREVENEASWPSTATFVTVDDLEFIDRVLPYTTA